MSYGANNPIAIVAAVPTLLLLTAAERAVRRRKGIANAAFADTANDFLSAAGHLAFGPMIGFAPFVGYPWVAGHLGLVAPLDPHRASTWVLGFLLVDFFYYWRHRLSHRVALLWAAHEVHHQSHGYDLAVAQRIGWFQDVALAPFVLPLALLGLPVEVASTCFLLNHGYQFFLHTELVGDLGPLGWVLMTPSHHRVHHAANPQYLDRNHGGFLSIWDRLFGTFADEVEAPVYGTTRALGRWSPVANNVGPIARLARKAWAAPGWTEAVAVLLRPPAWDPRLGHEVAPPPPPGRATAPEVTDPATRLAVVAAITVAIAIGTFLVGTELSAVLRVALGALALGLVEAAGRAMDGQERRSSVSASRRTSSSSSRTSSESSRQHDRGCRLGPEVAHVRFRQEDARKGRA